MRRGAASEATAHRHARIRLAGGLVLLALAALVGLAPALTERLRSAWLDAYQRVAPRSIESLPALVVEIDQGSLAALGRWPWPRTLLARLVEEVRRHRPAAIALDILMPEPDPLSPRTLVDRVRERSPAAARELAELPSNDAVLAAALAGAPVVLAFAGTPEPTGRVLRVVPFAVRGATAAGAGGVDLPPGIERFAGALTSLPELDQAAAGRGLISVEPSANVIRRVPLVASIGGTLAPALTVEMLRVAIGAPSLRLLVSGRSVEGIAIGEHVVPTDPDGALWVRYSPRDASRFVSALDVLEGRVDPSRLERKLVLIAVTGLGLGEFHATPLGERMPGSEIHAQLLENVYDEHAHGRPLLSRPGWAPAAEVGTLLALGAVLVWATPGGKPRNVALLALGCAALPALAGYALYRSQGLLLDAATPGVALLALFGVLLVLALSEATRQRRALQLAVQAQRERSARMAGELEAARRIQTATLPSPELLRGDGRLDLATAMVPAREVGGDLYDFFPLDQRRLFFLIGDVAGKGLSASIFMAVSKALCKSTALRSPSADLGALVREANAEVSRDNPELLFVTVFAAVLDLENGTLDYCSAGHEGPWLLRPGEAGTRRLGGSGGPPLCAVDGFDYRAARRAMSRGEWLCLVTDGVTEALDPAGNLYGSERMERVLVECANRDAGAREVVETLRRDVEAFADGTEAADDLTILVLRWNGPGTRG